MRKKSPLIYSLILIFILFLGCKKLARKSAPGSQDKIHAVSIATSVAENIPDIVELKGTFFPSQRLEVKSDMTGKVQALSVSEGQRVSSGEVLVKIDDESLPLLLEKQKAELREAEVQLDYNNKIATGTNPAEGEALEEQPLENPNVEEPPPNVDEEPAEPEVPVEEPPPENIEEPPPGAFPPGRLANQGVTPEAAEGKLPLDQAKVDRLRAEVALTEKQLAGSTMLATFEGMVSKVRVSEGAAVKPADVLLEVVSIHPVELNLDVPLEESSKMAIGLQAKVVVPDLAYANYSGDISYISPEIDTGKKTLQTKIKIPNPDFRIKAGMQGIAQLSVSEKTHRAVLIPGSALLSEGDKNYVYVVDDDVAIKTSVEIGSSFQSMVEVKKGVKADERVVTAGLEQLKEKEEFIRQR